MKLNCREGDLAVIVQSDSGHEGKIVECVQLYVGPWVRPDGALTDPEPGWIINSPVIGRLSGKPCWAVADRKLRPLRDSDGEDEVLRLVGHPVGTPQAA